MKSARTGIMGLTEIGFEDLAPGGMLQPLDSLFLDLSYTLTGQVELLTDFFKGMRVLSVQSEIQLNDGSLAMGQGRQGTLNLLPQRFV